MRVLIVDDHPSIAEGLRAVLASEFAHASIFTAASSEEATALASSMSPAIIIADLSMPGRDGPDLIRELARLAPPARILVYTVHSERQFGVRALRAGAHGYLTKDQSLDRFLEAIRKLMEGKRFISPNLTDDLIDALQDGGGDVAEKLSDRELQVLRLMGRGRSVGEIAAQLHLSGKTVSTYRSRVLEKLGLSSTAELIRYAIENGMT